MRTAACFRVHDVGRLVGREAAQAGKLKALGIDFELGTSYEAQARQRYGA